MKKLKVYLPYSHYLSGVIYNYLKPTGVVFVDHYMSADVQITSDPEDTARNIPTLFLSSSDVYRSSEPSCLSEDLVITIPSTRNPSLRPVLEALYLESRAFSRSSRALVLRIFNTYGPDIATGLIPSILSSSKEAQPILLPLPGYQEVTCLYQEDFIKFFAVIWSKFLGGLGGIYNVGATTPISMHRLADTVWQLSKNTQDAALVNLEKSPIHIPWKLIPDMTRSHAEFGVQATTSVRSGIWQMTR